MSSAHIATQRGAPKRTTTPQQRTHLVAEIPETCPKCGSTWIEDRGVYYACGICGDDGYVR